MLNCKTITKLLSVAQDRKLNLAEKIRLKLHTTMCSACRAFDKQLQELQGFSNNFINEKHTPKD
ncbi:zf-HC2 domain-containing protein [Candidatus Njordibacter sp. Uisw_056]|jgi:predicted anti-sigma-YlaC factor YlaD|uniref:zf-HC2 domain-containing protein n=1 Tax=Candidatus Njordibacter sp. Uisw_056 TaxID=3230973 RepID=UPI003D3D0DA2|tara:strand:+ start:513 stop:704 length:192 start_codon:yes stop_codon:yes gene_type:complete